MLLHHSWGLQRLLQRLRQRLLRQVYQQVLILYSPRITQWENGYVLAS